jgi:hypothetical protein
MLDTRQYSYEAALTRIQKQAGIVFHYPAGALGFMWCGFCGATETPVSSVSSAFSLPDCQRETHSAHLHIAH